MQGIKILVKIRIGDINAFSAPDIHSSSQIVPATAKRHGDPVIQMGINDSSRRGLPAVNDHSVICSLNVCAHSFQVIHHNRNPVRFLYLQLLSVPDHGCSFSAKAAITASMGISSIRVGISAPSMMVPFRLLVMDQKVSRRLPVMLFI